MSFHRVLFVTLLLAILTIDGCSSPSTGSSPSAAPASTPTTSTTPIAATAPAREDAKACDLVTSQEMSAILGVAVVGSEPADKSSGKTVCDYHPSDTGFPGVKLSVEWGEGEAAMRAAGAMGKMEPGIADPYAGIGDQAKAVGPTLWIRSGEDFVEIDFTGVDDAPAKAKKIFDTAKARM